MKYMNKLLQGALFVVMVIVALITWHTSPLWLKLVQCLAIGAVGDRVYSDLKQTLISRYEHWKYLKLIKGGAIIEAQVCQPATDKEEMMNDIEHVDPFELPEELVSSTLETRPETSVPLSELLPMLQAGELWLRCDCEDCCADDLKCVHEHPLAVAFEKFYYTLTVEQRNQIKDQIEKSA